MKRIALILLLKILILGSMGECFALSYSEGDDLDSQNIGTLDPGKNTVSGTLLWDTSNSNKPYDSDPFKFTVRPEMVLKRVAITYDTVYFNRSENTPSAFNFWNLDYLTLNPHTTGMNMLGKGTDIDLFSGLLIGVGEHSWTHSMAVTTGDGFSTDYTLSFYTEPAPVPEPATMLLFVTGIAGLVAIRRKKKA